MIDITQLSTKILPQVCTLAVDRHIDVRTQAILLLETGFELIKTNHEEMKRLAETEKLMNSKKEGQTGTGTSTGGTTGDGSGGGGGGNDGSLMWSLSSQLSSMSWSAVDGLTKVLLIYDIYTYYIHTYILLLYSIILIYKHTNYTYVDPRSLCRLLYRACTYW